MLSNSHRLLYYHNMTALVLVQSELVQISIDQDRTFCKFFYAFKRHFMIFDHIRAQWALEGRLWLEAGRIE